MLEYFLTVCGQIFSMALMVLVGYIMYKTKMINEEGTKQMSALLLKVVTPMILISSYQREFEAGLFADWIIMFAAVLLTYLIHIIIAEIVYKKKDSVYPENRLSIVLPNNSFMAFPILQALAGETGVFFGSINVIVLSALIWSYGVKLMNPGEKLDIKKIALNPGIIAVVGGVILFCSPWKLPASVYSAVRAIGSINTPLAMIVFGALLAQADLKREFKRFCYYKLAFLKLILLPIIMMVIFAFIPFSDQIRLVGFVCSVTPTATAVSMLSQLYDRDYRYATNAVVIITVLSAITMPVILSLGKIVIGY